MRKRKLVFLFALSAVITLSACNGRSVSQKSETQSVETEKASQEEKSAEITSKGVVDDKYEVEIISAKTASDYEGNPAIIVKYSFTNNSDKNASFLTSVGTDVFQNSVECDTAIIMSDVMDSDSSMAQVQPGGTATVECAYSLRDTENPVTVQVGPFINISDKINAQKEFTLK